MFEKLISGVNEMDGGGAYLVKTNIGGSVTYVTDADDYYLSSFFANINLRNSCYECNYANSNRVGDITIGDFWGVPEEMNDLMGTSVMVVNTVIGEKWAKSILDSSKVYCRYPIDLIINSQPNLKYPSWKHPLRDSFIRDMKLLPYSEACKMNICSSKSVALLNFHWENVNFGALLTAYALNRFLNTNGYYAQNIDYIPSFPWIPEEPQNVFFDSFRKKYLPTTKKISSGEDLGFLNEVFQNFVVGSDQVWRPEFIRDEKDTYFLNFADSSKNMISYGASFGVTPLDFDEKEMEEYSYRLKCFDYVSVREKNGVEICKRLGVDSTCVIDPVFLLDKKSWIELADEYEGDVSQDIVYYTINENIEGEMLHFIETKFPGEKYRNITWQTGVQEWLQRIRKCKVLVTDSFHGSCFALIFNVPLICINTNVKTSSRMESLFETVGSKNRVYSSFNSMSRDSGIDIVMDDYVYINKRIAEECQKGRKFLLDSLMTKKIDSDERCKRRAILCRFLSKKLKKQWLSVRFDFLRYKVLRFVSIGSKRVKYQRKYSTLKMLRKKIKGDLTKFEA